MDLKIKRISDFFRTHKRDQSENKHTRPVLEYAASILFPRRCPFCGGFLGAKGDTAIVCASCRTSAEKLRHKPPRLPETEHHFYAINSAASVFYYEGIVRESILLCKRGNHPWYARELADWMAVEIWGGEVPKRIGKRPIPMETFGIPLYHGIVPVPKRDNAAKTPNLPNLLALRLSRLYHIPMLDVLYLTREIKPQKELNQEERLRNAKDAYAVKAGTDLSGKRLLLVDDIITTGATVSACGKALLEAGASEVFAASIAATELRDKKQKKRQTTIQEQEGENHETAGHRN